MKLNKAEEKLALFENKFSLMNVHFKTQYNNLVDTLDFVENEYHFAVIEIQRYKLLFQNHKVEIKNCNMQLSTNQDTSVKECPENNEKALSANQLQKRN